MTESAAPSKSFKLVHWGAFALLFLLIVQPTFDNIRGLLTGALVMGDIRVEVTFAKMALHLVAMVMGWVGLWWFFQRQKRGAYMSIAAHVVGLIAALTQTPELLAGFPPAALAVFFVILIAVALGPIQLYKDQYC